MELLLQLGVLLLGYLLGTIPPGYILVKLRTGQDIRTIQSGRTGATNAARAAGLYIGLTTVVLDASKGFLAVYLARWLAPGNDWVVALTPIAALVGHNYSILMAHRKEGGGIKIAGGAGGAPVFGAAVGLWFPALFIMGPLVILVFYFVGYASLTTISVGVLSAILLAWRAYLGLGPWEYVAFGVLATLFIVWALRPNIRALRAGTERLHGYRARKSANSGESRA